MMKRITIVFGMLMSLLAADAMASPFGYITSHFASQVFVIDTATNQVAATISLQPGDAPVGVAVKPDGTRVYIGNHWGSNVAVIDTATNQVIANLRESIDHPHGVAINPAGTLLYVTNHFNSTISVFDTATLGLVAVIPVCWGPVGISVSPDGQRVYVSGYFSQFTVIDAATNTVIKTITDLGGRTYGIVVNPDGSRVYVANDSGLGVIDAKTNEVVAMVPGAWGYGVAVNPAGTRVYIGNKVIDAYTYEEIATITGFSGGISGISVVPDGSRVYAVNGESRSVLAIDAATNTIVATIPLGWDWNLLALGNFIGPVMEDTTPPTVSVSASTNVLWPPNHKMVPVTINGSASDDQSGIASVVITVADSYGTGNVTVPDFGSTIQLEAWRNGTDKEGRVYTITAVATDKAGNQATATTQVVVPHDMR